MGRGEEESIVRGREGGGGRGGRKGKCGVMSSEKTENDIRMMKVAGRKMKSDGFLSKITRIGYKRHCQET